MFSPAFLLCVYEYVYNEVSHDLHLLGPRQRPPGTPRRRSKLDIKKLPNIAAKNESITGGPDKT